MAGVLKPLLVVMIGLPGAGKSSLARSLARDGWLRRVDRDALRVRRFRRAPVTGRQKQSAARGVWRRVVFLLGRGHGVVVDGMTFARAAERREARGLARRMRARCVEVWLDCPVPLARRRVAADRRHPATDRSPALVAAVARRFEPVSRHALRLDARRSSRELRARLRRALRAGQGGCRIQALG